eukprot:4474364-Amphidinium_carterae.1
MPRQSSNRIVKFWASLLYLLLPRCLDIATIPSIPIWTEVRQTQTEWMQHPPPDVCEHWNDMMKPPQALHVNWAGLVSIAPVDVELNTCDITNDPQANYCSSVAR